MCICVTVNTEKQFVFYPCECFQGMSSETVKVGTFIRQETLNKNQNLKISFFLSLKHIFIQNLIIEEKKNVTFKGATRFHRHLVIRDVPPLMARPLRPYPPPPSSLMTIGTFLVFKNLLFSLIAQPLTPPPPT